MIQRLQIIQEARKYLDVPFQHMGRSERGMDCVGLIVRIAHDLGLSDYEPEPYSREPSRRCFEREWKNCEDIERKSRGFLDAQPGDILTMALPCYPCHVALLADNDRIIHALVSSGAVCEHGFTRSWKNRVRQVYQFKKADKWRIENENTTNILGAA